MDKREPIMTPCVCTICGWRWEAFFPDGLYENALGIECPECSLHSPIRNINGRFLSEEEIKEEGGR